MANLKDFVISFNANTKPLLDGIQQANNATNGFVASATKMLAGVAIVSKLKDMTNSFIELGSNLSQFSQQTGISVESIQILGNTLEHFGGNVETAKSSLLSLNSSIEQAKWGQGSLIEVSRKYGLQLFNTNGTMKNSEQLLKSIANTMSNYSKSTQMEIGKALGLDNSLIALLQSGSKEIDNLMSKSSKYGIMSAKDTKAMAQFKSTLIEIRQVMSSVGMVIIRYITPPLKAMVNGIRAFVDMVAQNKRIVIVALTAIGVALTPIIASLGSMAVASAIAFAPFLIAVGVITAIALIVEDIWGYFQGADSVTGELVKKFPALKAPLEVIRNIVIGIKDAFLFIVDTLRNFTFKAWLDDLKGIATYLQSLLPDWLVKFFGGDNSGGIDTKITTPPVVANPATYTNTNNRNINVNQTNNINTNNPMVATNFANGNVRDNLAVAVQQTSR